MAIYQKKLTTKRVESGFGTLIVVKHPEIVRVGQVFQDTDARGSLSWYAWVADYYGPGAPPVTERIPEVGGLRSMDELEAEMCEGLLKPRY